MEVVNEGVWKIVQVLGMGLESFNIFFSGDVLLFSKAKESLARIISSIL